MTPDQERMAAIRRCVLEKCVDAILQALEKSKRLP